jgi:hypothetical protein
MLFFVFLLWRGVRFFPSFTPRAGYCRTQTCSVGQSNYFYPFGNVILSSEEHLSPENVLFLEKEEEKLSVLANLIFLLQHNSTQNHSCLLDAKTN